MVVRIGIIGAGRMGKIHAGCLAEMAEARIVAVADTVRESAVQMAERTGATVYLDYRVLLDRERLDAVYICTPTGQHAEQAIAAAERHIPFFVEKPVTLNMPDAHRVARAVERNGVMTCVDYHWRYSNAVERAQEILAGRPLALTAAEWWWTLPPILWLRNKDLGGGQVVDQTTHLSDLCQLFAGPVVSVYAAYAHNTYTDAEFHNWDGYSLTFTHASGAVGSLRSTYALFPQIGAPEPPRIDLVAREMLLRITPAGLTVTTPEGKQEYPNSGPFHFGANRAFVSAVASRDECHIRSSVGETLRSLALTLAANESARTGQVVNLDAYVQATKTVAGSIDIATDLTPGLPSAPLRGSSTFPKREGE